MRHFILIFLASLSICSFGQVDSISQSELLGCWTDSREENTQNSNVAIFRPCDFKSFPSSRFRFRMDLKDNNICSWLYLAPDDGHYMKDGTWTFDSITMTLKVFNANAEEIESFVVIATNKDILKIKN
jgi:hypothetical protein